MTQSYCCKLFTDFGTGSVWKSLVRFVLVRTDVRAVMSVRYKFRTKRQQMLY